LNLSSSTPITAGVGLAVLKSLEDLDYGVYRSIVSLYYWNPLDHAYLLYDLLYDLDSIGLYLDIDEGSGIKSYMLVWRGPGHVAIHLWRYCECFGGLLERHLRGAGEVVIQLYRPGDLWRVTGLLEGLGVGFRVVWYLDMIVDENGFRPYNPEGAVRLRPGLHTEQCMELKGVQGSRLAREEAERILGRQRYYGVFSGSKLVSMAGRYIALPEVWVIGDVFTHPEYRGLGYAKTVTSAVTRDAVASGAKAYLHVERENKVAVRIYEKLGYRILRERPWIFISRGSHS
jgi:GNAT superfamily N-acetyltransferase